MEKTCKVCKIINHKDNTACFNCEFPFVDVDKSVIDWAQEALREKNLCIDEMMASRSE